MGLRYHYQYCQIKDISKYSLLNDWGDFVIEPSWYAVDCHFKMAFL